MKKIPFLMIFLAVIIGCEESLNPFAVLEKNVVAFSILDNRRPFQLVRVQKFYQSAGDKLIKGNCNVILTEENGQSYKLKDTVYDGSKDYNFYIVPDYKLKRDQTYRLSVQAESIPEQWAQVKVPPDPELSLLIQGGTFINGDSLYNYEFHFKNRNTPYFYFKALINYDVNINGKITSSQIEVPLTAKVDLDHYNPTLTFVDQDMNYIYTTYPVFMLNGTKANNVSILDFNRSIYSTKFENDAFIYALRKLQSNFSKSQINVKGGYLVFYFVDENYFKEFVKVGNESYSIRLDEPFYNSNFIQGKQEGFGFLGAITVDTLKFNIMPLHLNLVGLKNK